MVRGMSVHDLFFPYRSEGVCTLDSLCLLATTDSKCTVFPGLSDMAYWRHPLVIKRSEVTAFSLWHYIFQLSYNVAHEFCVCLIMLICICSVRMSIISMRKKSF
jgi:hypothetical protein